MMVINFAHPITEAQLRTLEELTGEAIDRVVAVSAQADLGRPLAPQVRDMVNRCGLSPEEWQTVPIVVNPPSLAVLAAAVVAELHGRMGYFPTVMCLRAAAGTSPPRFEVAQLVDLQGIRDAARARRMDGG
jgi:hypothetical protein